MSYSEALNIVTSKEMLVSIVSAVIGGLVAFFIARYQVNKSNEQGRVQRKEDIQQQQLFMINELKLKTTQKLLESTASVNSNVINMVHFSVKKHNHFLRHRINYSQKSEEATENRILIQQNYDEFQNYLSEVFTFINLFNIEKKKIDFEDLTNKSIELYNKCMNEDVYRTFNSEEAELEFNFYLFPISDKVINIINNIDHAVREKQIELIKEMQ